MWLFVVVVVVVVVVVRWHDDELFLEREEKVVINDSIAIIAHHPTMNERTIMSMRSRRSRDINGEILLQTLRSGTRWIVDASTIRWDHADDAAAAAAAAAGCDDPPPDIGKTRSEAEHAKSPFRAPV